MFPAQTQLRRATVANTQISSSLDRFNKFYSMVGKDQEQEEVSHLKK